MARRKFKKKLSYEDSMKPRFIPEMNKFAGADDIYLTKNSIAVRKVSTFQDKNGNYRMEDKTRYYDKTPRNISLAHKVHGFIRYGR